MVKRAQAKEQLAAFGMAINDIPLFDSMDEAECERLAAELRCAKYRRGDLVFKTGTRADRIYIICSGRIKIYKYLPDGREQILYIYTGGDFVGGFNLISASAYLYNARALETSLICTLNKERFNAIALQDPTMLLKILSKAFERVRRAERLVERLSSSSADEKVAGLLLDMAPSFGAETEEGLELRLSINREEMGSYTGLSRETVTRKLKQFQAEGRIALLGHKRIVLKDVEGLEAIAGRL